MQSTSETAAASQPTGTAIFSVIVPVLNDAARLERCLASIRANRYDPHFIQLIVADNGSVDDSPVVARRLGATVLSLPGVRVATLRNAAAHDAKGDILAFIDADHEIVPDWLARASEAFKDATVVGAGAAYSSPRNGNWVQRMYNGLRGPTKGRGQTDWLGSGNLAVRRTAFERVGGFDESLQTCEDVDLCQRLKTEGVLLADERLESVHLGDPQTLGAILRGELWRGRDNLRVSLRGPLSLRGVPSVAIPIIDDLLLLIGTGASFARAPWLAAAAFGGFCMLSLARCAKILMNVEHPRPSDLPKAFAVAIAYDFGRALSLFAPGSHSVRRRGAHA